jgi:hypothetical protein
VVEVDTSKGLVEASAAYKERQDATDREIRIGAAAYALLTRTIAGPHGGRVLGALYGIAGGNYMKQVPMHEAAVQAAYDRSTLLSIAAIHADFEWATRDLLADCLEFWPDTLKGDSAKVKQPPAPPHPLAKRGWSGTIAEAFRRSSADDGFLLQCYKFVGLTPGKKDVELLPIFDFYRRCRNRALHQDGMAGYDLQVFSQSQELKNAMATLPATVQKILPEVPVFNSGEAIRLHPRNATLFLIVARTLHNLLAARLRSLLDEEGYLRMAAYYAYGAPYHQFRPHTIKYKHVEDLVSRFLHERYQIKNLTTARLIEGLRKVGNWKVLVEKFHQSKKGAS